MQFTNGIKTFGGIIGLNTMSYPVTESMSTPLCRRGKAAWLSQKREKFVRLTPISYWYNLAKITVWIIPQKNSNRELPMKDKDSKLPKARRMM